MEGSLSSCTTCRHFLFKLSKHFPDNVPKDKLNLYSERMNLLVFLVKLEVTIHLTFYSLSFIVTVQNTWFDNYDVYHLYCHIDETMLVLKKLLDKVHIGNMM